jgi:hypothetical protein
MTNGKRTIAGLALGLMALAGTGVGVPSPAHADEVDDYTPKLVELDQRVQAMSAEFKEVAPPSPDIADRRVLDAQVLFSLRWLSSQSPRLSAS